MIHSCENSAFISSTPKSTQNILKLVQLLSIETYDLQVPFILCFKGFRPTHNRQKKRRVRHEPQKTLQKLDLRRHLDLFLNHASNQYINQGVSIVKEVQPQIFNILVLNNFFQVNEISKHSLSNKLTDLKPSSSS